MTGLSRRTSPPGPARKAGAAAASAMQEERSSVSRRGGTRADVDGSEFDVTISDVQGIRAPENGAQAERTSAFEELAGRMRESQQPILDCICELTGREALLAASAACVSDGMSSSARRTMSSRWPTSMDNVWLIRTGESLRRRQASR